MRSAPPWSLALQQMRRYTHTSVLMTRTYQRSAVWTYLINTSFAYHGILDGAVVAWVISIDVFGRKGTMNHAGAALAIMITAYMGKTQHANSMSRLLPSKYNIIDAM